jgi:hypothetical protein
MFERLGWRITYPALAVLAILFSSACATRTTPPGPDVAAGKFGQVSYVYLRWQQGLELMIWHDIVDASMGKGVGAAGASTYQYGGRAESADGREFTWQVKTEDGVTAEFRIDNTHYDLENGRLFIVTTGPGGTAVEQFERDMEDVQANRESCIAFAHSDPDVQAFLERHAGIE